ncbi:hypothetical protein ACL9RF_16825 [Sphingobacterium sp. Mn56C]|uniref:hypothetical protein n=1 Tax=Sphingobacterium sp. Mn56C TaxID=3395261 RepID=UPI003BEAD874
MMKGILFLTAAIGLLVSCQSATTNTQETQHTAAQEVTPPTGDTLSREDIAFGVLSDDKKGVIVLPDEENSSTTTFTQVYIPGAVAIRKTGHQQESATFNGRETADNFKDLGGDIYAITSASNFNLDYALLGTASFAKERKALAVKEVFADASHQPDLKKYAKSSKTELLTGKLIAVTAQNDSIFLAQLKPVADSVTVLLLCKEKTSGKIRTYPYTEKYNDMSTWSVDDAGEFPMDSYHILYAFQYKDKLELVTLFPGAEGGSFTYFTVDKNDRLKVLKQAYAYWSPL